jgi:hypothetical protein
MHKLRVKLNQLKRSSEKDKRLRRQKSNQIKVPGAGF